LHRVCLLALLVALGAARAVPLAAIPISRMEEPWWHQRFEEKQAELRRGPVDLVFYGDSITQNWEHDGPQSWNDFAPIWRHFYADRHAINLGFRGDATSHLLWRIDHGEASGIHPKVAVILIGANNFGRPHWSAAETVTGIDTILADLERRLPGTKILLLSVLPSVRSAWVTEQTEAVNRALASRDWHGTPVTFLDVTNLFLRDGKVDRSLFLDPLLTPPDPPLHPTAQTQEKIAEAMEPTLARLMGDKPH
jgi:lysophospholipase L1-like esterase